MSLSNVTKNWIKDPYHMDLNELKNIAAKEARAAIDTLETNADFIAFLNGVEVLENKISHDAAIERKVQSEHNEYWGMS